MVRIAMIGCGAIGAAVLELLHDESSISIEYVVVPSGAFGGAQVALESYCSRARVVTELPATECVDLLVECAGHAAIEQHVIPALERGIPCIVASVGALSRPGIAQRLEEAALSGRTQVELLSGAIGGIDAISAARFGGLDSVTYTGRKPPSAWKDTPAETQCDLDRMTGAHCIFEGNAEQAARLYPQNANVAATLSFAGVGLQRTRVQLFADPGVEENVHHVLAKGSFGTLEITLRGRPLPANPKTSALTVYSVVRALANRGRALAI